MQEANLKSRKFICKTVLKFMEYK